MENKWNRNLDSAVRLVNDESQLSVKDLLLSQSWEKRNEAKEKTPKK